MIRAHMSLIALAAAAVLAACSSGGQATMPAAGQAPVQAPAQGSMQQQVQQENTAAAPAEEVSVLKGLTDLDTIGSAVDPATGDVNPYGLEVAKVTAGDFKAGDLAICDFNDKANVQGTGTAILALSPVPGSKPRHVFDGAKLEGCNAIALAPDDTIWPADFSANDAPIITSTGKFLTAESNGPWHNPFGEAFSSNPQVPAFYVSNAGDGSLVRIGLSPSITCTTIVTGFPVNHGMPGSILGPSGLQYHPEDDALYVVDGTNNALYVIDNISKVHANGIKVSDFKFSGPDAADAHVVFHGKPLNGPISSAVLPDGHIAVGNTLDPAGKNLIVEITPDGEVVAVVNVDHGAAGAIFGMAATGTSAADTELFFNDDNDNTVKVLKK